ncbi:MAG: ATP-binding protein [Pseudolabrys sp.]
MGAAVELAGIALHWQVSELPIIAGLTARDALSIKLVQMEALSNILHHSKAMTTTLTAHYDEQTSQAVITVQDDGRGFNAGDASSAGRGITNMRKRIRAVSIGGTLTIESAPGLGTTIQIGIDGAERRRRNGAAPRKRGLVNKTAAPRLVNGLGLGMDFEFAVDALEVTVHRRRGDTAYLGGLGVGKAFRYHFKNIVFATRSAWLLPRSLAFQKWP